MDQTPNDDGKHSALPVSPAPATSARKPGDTDTGEFAETLMDDRPEIETDWWSESTDGQCSESAALFAASQPAPLSIV